MQIPIIGIPKKLYEFDKRQFQFQDFLLKPIMIECLIYILAKWIQWVTLLLDIFHFY